MDNRLEFPNTVWEAPYVTKAPQWNDGAVEAIYFQGIGSEEETTQVFAYIGFPAQAPENASLPAVVLLHGGTGTAFSAWVREWNQRGYAAIAVDLEGKRPSFPGAMTSEIYPGGGPSRSGFFEDINAPLEKQWIYHALAAAITANSLIRSDPRVDRSQVGLTGVSWGGFLTSILAGIDSRFAFGVPVYGSGYLPGEKSCLSLAFEHNPAAQRWEPSGWLTEATMPILWLNSDADPFFSAISTSRSFLESRHAVISFIHGYEHGHEEGWAREEVYAFADSHTGKGQPLMQWKTALPTGNHKATLIAPEGVNIEEATLYYAPEGIAYSEDGTKCLTEWSLISLTFDQLQVAVEVPDHAGTYYVAIKDTRGLVTSSPCLEQCHQNVSAIR